MKNETPTYRSWRSMKTRCLNRNHRAYHRYGGRGIRICDRWVGSFRNFLCDMGERPAGCVLDRINNDGNYEPGNCRWVSLRESGRNESGVRLSMQDAMDIRKLYKVPHMTYSKIGALYSIDQGHVHQIVKNRRWAV